MKYRELSKKVVTYGAGTYFNKFINYAKNCEVEYVIDKRSIDIFPYKLVHPDEIDILKGKFVVITLENPIYREEAQEFLERKGLLHYRDYAFGYEYLKWLDSEQFIEICEKETPIFSLIEIETINRCNMHCSFCPCNSKNDERTYARMTDELFDKITRELKDLDYAGDITLYSNNEPFLDKRTPVFAKKLFEACPKARIIIFTNTTLLTLDIFKETIPYVHSMVLDNYWKDKPMWNKNVQRIYEYIKDKPNLVDKVVFEMRYQEEVLTARAGYAPNKKSSEYIIPEWRCSRLYYDYVIRPDGEVSLCCNDAQASMTLGNVNKTSLIDVWFSEKFEKIRKKMIENGRRGVTLCNKCDAIYEGAPYLTNVRGGFYTWTDLNSVFLTNNKKNTIELYGRYIE